MVRINIEKFIELVELGFLTKQKHEEADLWIFNYTAKTQYNAHWIPETMMSRGLITNSTGVIMARPFEKFFNLAEYKDELPRESFEVFEKLDGSLGILYWIGEVPWIATRGSFYSKQALKATQILRQKYSSVEFDRSKTYLFEIIYPENRTVVDYGKNEDLILLAVRDTENAVEVPLEQIKLPFSKVKSVPKLKDLTELSEMQRQNEEGFVVRYKSGLRLKIKFAEYVRLHKLVTGVTPKAIWELLKSGMGVSELLEHVPDEFYAWVKQTQEQLNTDFSKIENEVMEIVDQAIKLPNRKEQAIFIREKSRFSGAVFARLDGKDYRKILWDFLRPKATGPFLEEI